MFLLDVAQLPSGLTHHEIQVAVNHGHYQTVHNQVSFTSNGMRIAVKLSRPYHQVTHVKVLTHGSPSWPAWREIGVYGR